MLNDVILYDTKLKLENKVVERQCIIKLRLPLKVIVLYHSGIM